MHSFQQIINTAFLVVCLLDLSFGYYGCPGNDWYYLEDIGTCYKYFGARSSTTYAQARQDCENHGAQVALARTPTENEHLRLLMSRDPTMGTASNTAEWDGIWLGGTPDAVTKVWNWRNDRGFQFTNINKNNLERFDWTNWYHDEPARNDACLCMRNDGMWNDVPCSTNLKLRYVCAKEIKRACPDDWILNPFTKRCYKLIDDSNNNQFAQAQRDCRDRNASLAMTKNLAEMNRLHSLFDMTARRALWLNMYPSIVYGNVKWTWDDGRDLDWVNWGWLDPRYMTVLHTIGMYPIDKKCLSLGIWLGGMWWSQDCIETNIAHVCTRPDLLTHNHVPLSAQCSPGWTLMPGTQDCYRYFDTKSAWSNASTSCRINHGAEIAHPRSAEENEFIFNLMKADKTISTGLVWDGIWIDPCSQIHPSSWSNWHYGQPDNRKLQYCATMTTDGLWNDVQCSHQDEFRSVCRRKSTTRCEAGWTLHNNKCFKYFDHGTSFWHAKDICEKAGTELATYRQEFIDKAHNKFLRHFSWEEFLRQNGQGKGVNDGIWVQSEEIPNRYFRAPMQLPWRNWMAGDMYMGSMYRASTPNTCVTLTWKTGQLHSEQCDQDIHPHVKLGFVCSKDRSAECHAGWQFNTEQKACYIFFNRFVTFDGAVQNCKRLGARLAESRSESENQFLNTVSGGHDGNSIWLYGTDREQEGWWKWGSDGHVFAYTNWHPGSPSNGGRGGNEDCLYMGQDTKWDDVPCNHSFKHVCVKPPIGGYRAKGLLRPNGTPVDMGDGSGQNTWCRKGVAPSPTH